MMLLDILPKDFLYKIEKNIYNDIENFQCELRCNINKKEDFSKWLKEFAESTNTSWILQKSNTKQNSHYVFSRNFICQHSSYRKTEDGKKNKNCTAALSVRIKKNSRFIRYRDPLLNDGFFTIIKINFQHSHKVNVDEAWNWLPRSEETKRIVVELFNSGLTPAATKNCLESLILCHSPKQLANSRINPPVRWIYDFHEKWVKKNYGGIHQELDINRLTQWLVAINREDLLKTENGYSEVYNSGRLCSSHFSENCFTGNGKKKLIKNAVPNQLTSPIDPPSPSVTGDTSQKSSGTNLEVSKNKGYSPSTKDSKEDITAREKKLNQTKKNAKEDLKTRTEDCMNENYDPYPEPDRIIGATDVPGELLFLIKWKDVNEADLIPSRIANEKYPQLVIQFYESRLMWNPPNDNQGEEQ